MGGKKISALLVALVLLALCRCSQRAWAWKDCEEDDIYGIYGHCGESIQRKGNPVAPSPLCCSFINDAAKLTCVCTYLVTSKVEKEISVPRLACNAKLCGAPLSPGTKCGRYTIPELGKQCS